MKSKIEPSKLKALRAARKMSQQQLSDTTRGHSTVSVPTIKRIEAAGSPYEANSRVADGLAKALGVTIEELARVPTPTEERSSELRDVGLRSVKATIDADNAMSFEMVQSLYGISVRGQIELAPLLTAMLADASLVWRRKRLAKIDAAVDELMSLGGGHYSFAYAGSSAADGAQKERASIERRDFFGAEVSDAAYDFGYDPGKNNPFVDYIRSFVAEIDNCDISIEPWINTDGLPEYRVGARLIEQLTSGDLMAERALLHGHVKIKDIPVELMAEHRESDRVTWMISQIPEQKRQRLEALDAQIAEKLSALGL